MVEVAYFVYFLRLLLCAGIYSQMWCVDFVVLCSRLVALLPMRRWWLVLLTLLLVRCRRALELDWMALSARSTCKWIAGEGWTGGSPPF